MDVVEAHPRGCMYVDDICLYEKKFYWIISLDTLKIYYSETINEIDQRLMEIELVKVENMMITNPGSEWTKDVSSWRKHE